MSLLSLCLFYLSAICVCVGGGGGGGVHVKLCVYHAFIQIVFKDTNWSDTFFT